MEVACHLGLESGCPLKQALHRSTGRPAAQGGGAEGTGGPLEAGLAAYNRRSLEQGLPAFGREDVTGRARLRLYVAAIGEAWVLDQDATVDQRAPVPLPGATTG